MRVKVTRSPKSTKKFRATLEDGSTVDFGARGYSDYTLHKNPLRMRSYVSRHGGKIPMKTKSEENSKSVHNMMKNITLSSKENWKISGIKTAGFWSRWYLWSDPTIKGAKSIMKKKFGIIFT